MNDQDNQTEQQDQDNQTEQQNQIQEPPVHTWRITLYEYDRAPREKVMTCSFCTVWESSLPRPDMREDWHILWKHDVNARFDAGTRRIIVCKNYDDPRATYTAIERLHDY